MGEDAKQLIQNCLASLKGKNSTDEEIDKALSNLNDVPIAYFEQIGDTLSPLLDALKYSKSVEVKTKAIHLFDEKGIQSKYRDLATSLYKSINGMPLKERRAQKNDLLEVAKEIIHNDDKLKKVCIKALRNVIDYFKVAVISTVFGTLALAGACGGGTYGYFLNAVAYDKCVTDIPDEFNVTYGDTIDFSKYFIQTYNIFDDELDKVDVTSDMIKNYTPNKIGNQTAKLVYGKYSKNISITTNRQDLETITVNVSDNQLEWNPVINADSYDIYLGQSEDEYKLIAQQSTTTFNLVDVDNVGVNYAYVIASSSTGNYFDSKSNIVSFNKLAKPETITYEDGILSWNSVDNASGYEISVNDIKFTNDTNSLAVDIKDGNNIITIKANGKNDNIDSDINEFVIGKLGKLNLAISDSLLTWNKLDNAANYDVYIDGVLAGNVIDTTYSLRSLSEGCHNIKVKANIKAGYDVSFNSEASISAYLNGTANVKNEVLTYGVNAARYQYRGELDGSVLFSYTNETSYDFTSTKLAITAGDHEVKIFVKDSSNNEEYFMKSLHVNKLNAPVLAFENQKIVIKDSYNMTMYANDEVFNGSLTSLINPGEYKIKAINISNSDNQLTSDYSNTLDLTRLDTPTISLVNDKLVSSITSGVTYYQNGEVFDGDISKLVAGTYNITAQLKAKNNHQLDGALSNTLQIKVLPTPLLSIGEDLHIKHNNLDRSLTLKLDGQVHDGDLAKITQAGEYKVTGQYLGNNELGEVSSKIATLKVTKLPKPVNSVSNGEYHIDNRYPFIQTINDNDNPGLNYKTMNITTYFVGDLAKGILPSEVSDGIIYNYYKAPILSVKNNKLVVDQELATTLYVDGKAFDNNFASLDWGLHTFTARYNTSNGIAQSDLSNEITLRKPATPSIRLGNKGIETNDLGNMTFIVDGQIKTLDEINNLSQGVYHIKGYIKGDYINTIDSNYSNELIVKVGRPANLKVTPTTNNRLYVTFDQDPVLRYDIKVEFLKAGLNKYPDITHFDMAQNYLYVMMNGKDIDEVKITLTVTGNSSGYLAHTYTYTYTI